MWLSLTNPIKRRGGKIILIVSDYPAFHVSYSPCADLLLFPYNQPETFVKVRPRCEAPRRDMIYPLNYTPCRYVRISCLRGNPIAIFFIQVNEWVCSFSSGFMLFFHIISSFSLIQYELSACNPVALEPSIYMSYTFLT
uniref:Uncharacterized protein n=1 Tax=Rhizophora mucronata TaxID=61149 RepID=A0A2P2M500_RHIMU